MVDFYLLTGSWSGVGISRHYLSGNIIDFGSYCYSLKYKDESKNYVNCYTYNLKNLPGYDL